MRALLAGLSAAACLTAAAADYVSIGLQLPFEDPVRCITAWQYFHIARTAARFIETTDWWKATGASLRLEVLPSKDPYTAWQSSVRYALEPAPTCTPAADGAQASCRVFRAGILGPWDLQSTQLVQLVTRMGAMVHMSYAATDDALTQDDYKPVDAATLQPFFRATHTDTMAVGALFTFIRQSGWRIFTILHAREAHSDDCSVLLSDLVAHAPDTKTAIWNTVPYDPTDEESIERALTSIDTDVARVVVLFAYSKDAAPLLIRADQKGMTGKGWTWLGTEWVREFTWVAASMPDVSELVQRIANQTAAAEAAGEGNDGNVFGGDGIAVGEGGGMARRLDEDAAHTAAAMRAAADLPPEPQQSQRMRELAGAGAQAAAGSVKQQRVRGVASIKRAPDASSAAGFTVQPAAGAAAALDAAPTAAAASGGRKLASGDVWWGISSRYAALTIPTNTGKVMDAMRGAVGVVPFRIPPEDALGGFLDRFRPDMVADTSFMGLDVPGAFPFPALPTEAQCFLFNNAPATTVGLPLDLFGPYVFDAVFAIASATAEALTGSAANASHLAIPFSNISSMDVARVLASVGSVRPSMLTGHNLTWLPNGDRYGLPLSLVNVQADSKVVNVGAWLSAVRPRAVNESGTGLLPAGMLLTDGQWVNMTAITWPGNAPLTPPDRSIETNHAGAAALVVAVVGVIISLLMGSVVHHAGISVLPESGVTVLVGAAFGVLLRFAFGEAVQETAGFNEGTFMLVLLPIIIFESGYSLSRRPFFSQLFSISAFAIAGTVISTVVIGVLVFWAGSNGSISQLSFEESMSFASLLSATDPVATLAVFSSLRVHPTLYALVYGESVINDAVAIVLYRTFTGFLVNEITNHAVLYAVWSFLGVLLLSVFVGVLVGMLATCAFRYVNVTGQDRHVRWEREFHAKVDQLKRFIPKLPELQLEQPPEEDESPQSPPNTDTDTEDEGEQEGSISPASEGSRGGAGLRQRAAQQQQDVSTPVKPGATIAVASAGTGTGLAAPALPLAIAAPPTSSRDADAAALLAEAAVSGSGSGDSGDEAQTTLDNVDLMSGIAETSILLLFGYASFSFAEAIALSGIVASLFCGITMNMYTRRVLTRDGKVTSTAVFKMLSTLADTAVFFQIGLNVILTLHIGNYNMAFIVFTLFACLLARAANIFPVSYMLNKFRSEKIPLAFQLQMWHAGLRGAIAYATALGFPSQHQELIVNATSWICLFTIFTLGGSTPSVLTMLQIPYNVDSAAFYRAKEKEDALAAAAAADAAAAGDDDGKGGPGAGGGIDIKGSMERRVKSAMGWLDRWIQRVTYGRRFLHEMETANAVAGLKARKKAAHAMGVAFPAELERELETKEATLHDDADDKLSVHSDEEEAAADGTDGAESATPGERTARLAAAGETDAAREARRARTRNPAMYRGTDHFAARYDAVDRAYLRAVWAHQRLEEGDPGADGAVESAAAAAASAVTTAAVSTAAAGG